MRRSSILKTPMASAAQARLDLFLSVNPDIALCTWVAPNGHAVIDLLRIPEHQQGLGIGRRVYELWEDTLTEDTVVELFAVDADATAFWRAMGFDGPFNGVMSKRITRLAMAA